MTCIHIFTLNSVKQKTYNLRVVVLKIEPLKTTVTYSILSIQHFKRVVGTVNPNRRGKGVLEWRPRLGKGIIGYFFLSHFNSEPYIPWAILTLLSLLCIECYKLSIFNNFSNLLLTHS